MYLRTEGPKVGMNNTFTPITQPKDPQTDSQTFLPCTSFPPSVSLPFPAEINTDRWMSASARTHLRQSPLEITLKHTHTRANTHMLTQAHTHARMHANAHTHTLPHTQTHTTHTHAYAIGNSCYMLLWGFST